MSWPCSRSVRATRPASAVAPRRDKIAQQAGEQFQAAGLLACADHATGLALAGRQRVVGAGQRLPQAGRRGEQGSGPGVASTASRAAARLAEILPHAKSPASKPAAPHA